MHDHGHVHPGEEVRARSRRALLGAMLVTAGFAVAEVIGGLLTGSLALLADAGHMATDMMALALGMFAAWIAGRPRTPRKTYGYYRTEILAAFINGAALVLISAVVIWQAASRLSQPADVESGPMLVVAVLGLLANLVAAGILLRAGGNSLNVRGALWHVAGDALGSVGAIIAAVVILTTGWGRADALVSLFIALLILAGAWRLLRASTDVLLEGTPAHINLGELEDALTAVPGVTRVHDVHVWTVTSGFDAMSGHAELDGSRDAHDVLDDLTRTLIERFAISHVTIQPEPAAHADCHGPGCDDAPFAAGSQVSAAGGPRPSSPR